MRCHTRRGQPVTATEARWLATRARIRRVVLDPAGLVVDLGRRRRLFTGAARDPATALTARCFWPGCSTPVAATQIGHLTAWAHGGTTDPTNAAPACGSYHGLKNHGWTTHRNQHGNWTIH